MSQELPNLIIAGVNKGGTTSLFSYLSEHEEICPSSVKETCYFLPVRYGEEIQDFSEYKKFFRHCKNQKYVMESTPGYFYGGRSLAEYMATSLGSPKILVVLREPGDRLISFFRFMKSMMEIDDSLSLEKYVEYCNSLPYKEKKKREYNPYWGVEGGRYADYVSEWFEVYGEGLKIIFFEDLKTKPIETLVEVCDWLEIDPYIYKENRAFGVENKTINYKWKAFHRLALKTNSILEPFFRRFPYIKVGIRNLYYRFNERGKGSDITHEERVWAKNLYIQDNIRLANILKYYGVNRLPSWLEGS